MSSKDSLRAILCGGRTAILGVGSVLRSDDGAGMYLIELLERALGDRCDLLLLGGSTAPENFTGVIKDFAPDTLLVVDASQMNRDTGTVELIPEDRISGATFSTHMLPMPVMLSYLREECGCAVHVIGIQPKSIEMGEEMCAEVRTAVETLAADITEILK